jgi:uncharacterized membrane protein YdjX (TVP38/TMEM64 family)
MKSARLAQSATADDSRNLWLTALGVALAIAALSGLWRYTPVSELITPAHVRSWAKAARGTGWGPLALIVAYVPTAFVLLPRPALTLFGVVAFGPWLGLVCASAGIALSSIAGYYAGRAVAPRTLERLSRGKAERVKKKLRRHGIVAVATLRVLPTAPYIVESMICGALRIRLWEYIVGTLIGMMPGVVATTIFGHQIAAALEDLSKVNYWIVGAAVLLFVAFMFVMRRFLAQR